MVKFTIAPLLLIPAILSAIAWGTPVKRQIVVAIAVVVHDIDLLLGDVTGLYTVASSMDDGLTFTNALVKLIRVVNRRKFELFRHRNLIKASKLLIAT